MKPTKYHKYNNQNNNKLKLFQATRKTQQNEPARDEKKGSEIKEIDYFRYKI